LLKAIQSTLRLPLRVLRRVLDTGFVPVSLNPLRHLGALTIFFCWIVLVSGLWLFIFFRTSVDGAYESLEYLTHKQWYLGGVMRSLHRYASDGAIITLVLHIVREFAFDRYRGNRWFSWVTGIPLLWLIIPLGITGYWLVWDELAQYVALASAEMMDWLPIFSNSMARNFLSDEALSDRFFTLMAFMHLIGLPLFLVFGIWLHVLRINGPEINPPRVLMSGTLLAMLVLSLVFPALSQDQADLATVPDSVGMDWYYLLIYPLISRWDIAWVWALLVGISLLIAVAPWLPPKRPRRVAVVDLENCNGCERCVIDCPFGALTMEPRSDGKAYTSEAVVDEYLCLSCGICIGSCPTATPFRTRSDLVPGIDLPDYSMEGLRTSLREAAGMFKGDRRVFIFGCEGAKDLSHLADEQTAVINLTCMAQLPPSFVDFVLSRDLADGILLAGCVSEACQYRFGADWTAQRINRQRDPRLRKRVNSEQLALGWQAPWNHYGRSADQLAAFRETLGDSGSAGKTAARPGSSRTGILSRQAIAYGVFAVLVGLFSIWPRYRLIGDDEAMISLTFSHAGQRVEPCRRLSQDELMKLPPNMRKPNECPRERHPVVVTFSVDGEVLYSESKSPSGIWNDGVSTVYKRMPVKAGEHDLFIGMHESGPGEDFDFQRRELMTLEAGQHVVVEFDITQQQFIIR
jgi:ferredoxin/coenzyme F420-reducing hydrogenase delta subunit